MAHKKKKNREEKEALRKGKIGEYMFFGGQEDQPLIPQKKDWGKSGSGYKTTRQCPFLLGIKPGGVGGGWGAYLPGEDAEGTRKPSLPMAPDQVIFHC